MARRLLQRAGFMARLLVTVAGRARPRPAAPSAAESEHLIEALQTGDIAALDRFGAGLAEARDSLGNAWFFIALDTASPAAVAWFLRHGASATAPDRTGRLPLEVVIQRAALADDFDDHIAECPEMARMLLAAGASLAARSLNGRPLADLAREAGMNLAE